MKSDLNSLKEILKGIRDTEFPEVTDEVIDNILDSVLDHPDDKTLATTEIRAIVSNFVKSLDTPE